MDLGWRHWTGAGGHELVEPSFLASRRQTTERSRAGAPRDGLGPLAWTGAGTALQSCVFTFCLARVERLRLRRFGGHGIVQFRHNLSRLEAAGACECGVELQRSL